MNRYMIYPRQFLVLLYIQAINLNEAASKSICPRLNVCFNTPNATKRSTIRDGRGEPEATHRYSPEEAVVTVWSPGA